MHGFTSSKLAQPGGGLEEESLEDLASPPEERTAHDSPLAQEACVLETMRLSRAKRPARTDAIQEGRSHISLMDLPVEILAKILDLVVGIPFPISTNEFEMLCTGANCGIIIDRKRSEIKQALADCSFPIFHTSQMLRSAALSAFVRVNTWDLQPDLLLIPRSWPTPLPKSGLSIASLVGIRNFYMRLDLCSTGFDILSPGPLQLPLDLDRSDKLACRRWIYNSQTSEDTMPRKQTEYEVCDEHVSRLDSFVSGIIEGPDSPRTLTVDIVIHRGIRLVHPKLDQCGLTLKIEIKLHTDDSISSTSSQLSTPNASKEVPCEFSPPSEHRRRLMVPLLRLKNIQQIDVKRSWTVKYAETKLTEVDGTQAGSIFMTETVWKTISMGLHMHYKTVMDFLKAVGKDYCNFTSTGLREMRIKADQVVGFEENTAWNDKTILIPPAPPGYFGTLEQRF